MEDHYGPELARAETGQSVIACATCGFAHFWPRPGEEELARYYGSVFYETFSAPDWSDKEEAEQPYWAIEHGDRLAAFAELTGKPAGRLLDVGCGGGWLLAYALERGWEVTGIEPSRKMWERATRIAPVILGMFPDVDLSCAKPFDVVHLKLVIEHVADPAVILSAARGLLRPGGVVCVEVPNDFNPLQLAAQSRLRKPAWWVVYPVHVNYFTFESLEQLLRRSGFEPVRREATFPMEWFLLQGTDYIGRDDIGRECHRRRMALEMELEAAGLSALRRRFAQWLASNEIGRTAVVYARRADTPSGASPS